MLINIDDADAQNKVSDEIVAKYKREKELDKLRFKMALESDEVLVVKKIICADVITGDIFVRGTTFEEGENGGIEQTSEEVVSIRSDFLNLDGTGKSTVATDIKTGGYIEVKSAGKRRVSLGSSPEDEGYMHFYNGRGRISFMDGGLIDFWEKKILQTMLAKSGLYFLEKGGEINVLYFYPSKLGNRL